MIRFGLLGIPVSVHWWFWLTAALLSGALDSARPDAVFHLLGWLLVVFISVLWHELGHALMFRRFGCSSEIVLQAFGGYTAPLRGRAFTRWQNILISAAGPGFGLLLWSALFLSLRMNLIPTASIPRFVAWIVLDLLVVNLWWSLINLLPVGPLDGAKILSAAMGPRRAREALIISISCGAGAALLALSSGQFFLGVLFGVMAYDSFQKLQGGPRVGGAFGTAG